MNEVKQILLLYHQAIPIKQIARQLGMSKNTVKAYLKRFEATSLSKEDVVGLSCPELQARVESPGLSDQERYKAFLEQAPRYLQELQNQRHLTKLLLWEEFSST